MRDMSPADLEQVLAIENLCYSTPWSLNSFKHEIENKDTILKVAVFNDRIAGYVCIRTILYVTHLMNITVLPELRHKGVGQLLLKNAIEDLQRLKPGTKLTLEVRKSNTSAIKLYEKFGFHVTGQRKNYYQKPDDDAILMELDINY